MEEILTYQHLEVKVKLPLCLIKYHVMKTYWGSGDPVLCILNLGTRWEWVVSFMPWQLYIWGKNLWYPLDRRLGGPQCQSGHCGKKIPFPCWESNLSCPASTLVTILTFVTAALQDLDTEQHYETYQFKWWSCLWHPCQTLQYLFTVGLWQHTKCSHFL
jgi:hypothetical protein